MSDLSRWAVETEALQREVHELAVSKGFWEKERSFAHCIALVHSELSEAIAADRVGDIDHVAEELADAVIRIMDLAQYNGVNLAREVRLKHNRNKMRPHLHGKRY